MTQTHRLTPPHTHIHIHTPAHHHPTSPHPQLTAIKWMDARGELRTTTPTSDPHMWRALTVSVGRLGVLLELTFRIVGNKAVRRSKEVRRGGRGWAVRPRPKPRPPMALLPTPTPIAAGHSHQRSARAPAAAAGRVQRGVRPRWRRPLGRGGRVARAAAIQRRPGAAPLTRGLSFQGVGVIEASSG